MSEKSPNKKEPKPDSNPIEKSEEPEFEVNIWLNAKNSPNTPCKIIPLGFDIKAYASDYVRIDLRGKEDFPEGAWITANDLTDFINKLSTIEEKINDLPLFLAQEATVLWVKERGETQ